MTAQESHNTTVVELFDTELHIEIERQKFNAAGYGVAGQGGAHTRHYEVMGDSFES